MSKWIKVTCVCTYDGEETIQPGCIRTADIVAFNSRHDGLTEILLKGDLSHALRVKENFDTILAAVTE